MLNLFIVVRMEQEFRHDVQPKESEPDLLRGFVSDCEDWRDALGYEFNSSTGFLAPLDENHINPVLVTFAMDIAGKDGQVRHLRQKNNGRYLSSIVIVERARITERDDSDRQVESFSEDTRGQLQARFNDFSVPYDVYRIFKSRHSNGSLQTKHDIEYLGFELRDKEIDSTYGDLAIHGDNDAFQMIYDEYFRRIDSYVRGILGRADRPSNMWVGSEDIAQEVFLNAYKARKRFTKYENIPIAAWLFRIAANATRNHLRSGHFNQISELPVDTSDDVPRELVNEDLLLELQIVSENMGSLTPRRQQLLALYSLGYTDIESAWILGLPTPNDAKVLRHKGRIQLKNGVYPRVWERELTQYYLVTLAHRLVTSKARREKVYWREGQLKTSVLQSLKGLGFRESQVRTALAELPGDFFDRLANIHTVPR